MKFLVQKVLGYGKYSKILYDKIDYEEEIKKLEIGEEQVAIEREIYLDKIEKMKSMMFEKDEEKFDFIEGKEIHFD